jgi:uncharacterized membrane protein YtjA (UPF0391 family)
VAIKMFPSECPFTFVFLGRLGHASRQIQCSFDANCHPQTLPSRPGWLAFSPRLEPVPPIEVRSASCADGSSRAERAGGSIMTLLKWALIFFLVSVVAGILGFTGISAASADVARFLFYVFVVIFLVLLVLGLTIFRV